MASIPKKTPTAGQASATAGRNSPANGGATSPSPAPRRSGTGAAPSTPSNGIARTRSVRTGANGSPVGARTAVKKPAGASDLKNSTSASAASAQDEDARMESTALLDELKEKLSTAESASSDYQKQIEVLQSRLDEAIAEQGKLEDKLHEEEERVEGLENEKRDAVRGRREIETIYEAERAASMREREEMVGREEELREVVTRLKDSLSQKEHMEGSGRMSRTASSPTLETGFAPPSSLQRSNSRNNSKLILQKDQLIESLRLELAEVQIKMMELENMSDASRRVQELERTVLEQRMTNARLMEDIDSYQLLLSERTLNGDFSRNDLLRSSPAPEDRMASHSGPATSLADELSSLNSDDGDASGNDNIPADTKKLQSEVQTLKDSNKALTLYINKIIDRILQHQGGYENILSNADDDAPAGAQRPPPPPPNKDKDLPPPPPPKEEAPAPTQSFLQRASSVIKAKPRPQSAVIQPAQLQPSVIEDPTTAPSIPLNRTASKRMTVDLSSRRRSTQIDHNAAAIVGNMYRGPSPGEGPASPSIVSPRNSFFGFRQPSGNAPTVSSIREDGGLDDETDEDSSAANRRSALDALNGGGMSESPQRRSPSKNRDSSTTSGTDGVPSVDTPSPPRGLTRSDTVGGGGVMTGNKMRPLRLAQAAEAEKKANNRASWAVPANIAQGISGWWNKEGAGKEAPKEGGA